LPVRTIPAARHLTLLITLITLIPASPASAQESAGPRLLQGHRTKIASLAISRDGRLLASGGGDRSRLGGFGRAVWLDCTIRVWDVGSGKLLHTLEGHQWTVSHLAFSGDGTRLLSASGDKAIRIWDVRSGELIRQFDGLGSAISPDGRLVAIAAADGPIDIFDVHSGEQSQRMIGHIGDTTLLAFGPDGGLLVSAGLDNAVRVWDLATGKAIASMTGAGMPRCLAFSAGGRRIVSLGQDKVLRTWDVQGWKPAMQHDLDEVRQIARAAFSANGSYLALLADGAVAVWNVEDGRPLSSMAGEDRMLSLLAIGGDGAWFAAASTMSTHVMLFSLRPGAR
jgi:WD40 repeat protein